MILQFAVFAPNRNITNTFESKHEVYYLIQSKPEYMIPEDALYHR
jgi:hypothetical protein